MQFDFESIPEEARYKLMLATVLPRPIAWVTSQDGNGLVNAAPFSFFNVFGSDPATVGLGVGRSSTVRPKDTRLNIRATEEFVVNLVPFSAAEKMRNTSMPFPPGISEVDVVGLSTLPSLRVKPPRIAESPVSFECRFMQEIRLGNFSLMLGRIVLMHIADEAVSDPDRLHIDTTRLDLIGRMEGTLYTRTLDKFEPQNLEQARALLAQHNT
ncbi:flavin reductase family protein [Bradyrhizobium prioriisuperbiae]|uniref:flavin reductase family protein n=1 Tax=Bradyrhizobium prioriisuperbiae TaxID=2854389 RepID=UPI0028EC8C7B|nr:flavin reductase family protein [Bradyrhizobium prioritasuperba]